MPIRRLLCPLAVAIVCWCLPALRADAQTRPSPHSLPTPLMGWNPFNAFGQNYDESVVYSEADQLIKLKLADLGYRFVDIDDSWWLRRLPQTIQVNTRLYPDAQLPDGKTSMRPFVEHIHGMGLKAGIYTDIGRNSCSQAWETKNTSNLPLGTLEERQIGSYGHQAQDTRLFFATWGFDLVKVDACGVDNLSYGKDVAWVTNGRYAAYDPSIIIRSKPGSSRPDQLNALYQSFWQDALQARPHGPQPIVALCSWGEADVNDWGHLDGQMWRTSADIHASWDSMLYNFDSAAPRSLFAGPGRWNDPDMLEVGNGAFDANHLEEARAHMSMWAILAAPLVLGTDLRDIAPPILSVIANHEVVAVDQDPAGNQGVILRETVDGEIVAKALSTRGQKAVALINRSAQPLTLSVDLADLHLSASAGATVHDVWRGTTGQVKGTGISASLAPHETALLLVTGRPREDEATFPDEMPARIVVSEDGFQPADRSVAHQWIPARIGFLPDGHPVLAEGHEDHDALGVAAGSRVTIDLAGQFRTVVLSPRSLRGEAEPFQILADGRVLAQGPTRATGEPLTLQVGGVYSLTLVAPPASAGIHQFTWQQVRFIR